MSDETRCKMCGMPIKGKQSVTNNGHPCHETDIACWKAMQARIAELEAGLASIGAPELLEYISALEAKFGSPIYDEDMMVTLELAPAYPTGLWFLTAGQIRKAAALLASPPAQQAQGQEGQEGVSE